MLSKPPKSLVMATKDVVTIGISRFVRNIERTMLCLCQLGQRAKRTLSLRRDDKPETNSSEVDDALINMSRNGSMVGNGMLYV